MIIKHVENTVAPETARELFDVLRESPIVGDPRAAMIERLQLIFERCTPGLWRTFKDSVLPLNVGCNETPDGSGYAICCFGPRGYCNGDWIAAIHNDWPMLVALLIELCKQHAPSPEIRS